MTSHRHPLSTGYEKREKSPFRTAIFFCGLPLYRDTIYDRRPEDDPNKWERAALDGFKTVAQWRRDRRNVREDAQPSAWVFPVRAYLPQQRCPLFRIEDTTPMRRHRRVTKRFQQQQET